MPEDGSAIPGQPAMLAYFRSASQTGLWPVGNRPGVQMLRGLVHDASSPSGTIPLSAQPQPAVPPKIPDAGRWFEKGRS